MMQNLVTSTLRRKAIENLPATPAGVRGSSGIVGKFDSANRLPLISESKTLRSAAMRSTCLAILLIFSILTIGGCNVGEFSGSTSKPSPGGNRLAGRLVLTGSSTIAPLAQEIASRFERQYPGVRIDVQTGGSSRGIRDASKGAADIGMSSRHLKDSEAGRLNATIIAWDGVAFVVHQENQTPEMTRDHLRQIYTGKVMNWSQLGGGDQRIVVSNRAAGRSELDLVCNFLDIQPGDIKADIVDGETQQSLKSVINNRQAITYTSVGAAQDAVTRGQPLKLLPLDGVAATSATVKSGTFPLARPLIFAVSQDAVGSKLELIEAFIDFATSNNVSDAAVGLGYVPVAGHLTSPTTK